MLPLTRECAFFWRIMDYVTITYEQVWSGIGPQDQNDTQEDFDLLLEKIEEQFFLNVPQPIGFY